VINKNPGLVVHPAPGHYSGTLVNALLYHCPDLSGVGGEIRPGIVHRLDKNTSGTLVVAKTASAHEDLARQFKDRRVQKKYLALVFGEMTATAGTIELPIGRHPVDRKRMSTKSRKGRKAKTAWRVRKQFRGMTLLELDLKTGRTHQIRVHCAAVGHAIIGDPVYCPRKYLKKLPQHLANITDDVFNSIKSVQRQMLHAWKLGFVHPHTGDWMVFESPLPADMREILHKLSNYRKSAR
jgi:23S rRNA pseudouridine1911/1915/1917 synthase